MKHTVSYPLYALGALGTAFVLGAVAYMPFVIKDSKKQYCDKCECLIILGGEVLGAQTPCVQLTERMKAASEYLNKNKNVVAVACGGCFRKNQKKSEADIIADYLIKNGTDKSRIITEDKSTTTFENFTFAKKIIENHFNKPVSKTEIAFLSSSYHIHRAKIIAKRCGIKDIRCVSCKTSDNALKSFVREYFVAFELLFHR